MTIDELKLLQNRLDLNGLHLVYLGPDEFSMAHTDDERAAGIDLTTCRLHRWLASLDEQPRETGVYILLEPDRFMRIDTESL